ncbi:MAG: fumarylacetoacetase [Candidatus Xenobia bacterium]
MSKAWVPTEGTDFPLENLPYGVFNEGRIGVAIGHHILDLKACLEAGLIDQPACDAATLNGLMGLPTDARRKLRARITELLSTDGSGKRHLVSMAEVQMRMPAEVGDYTDFYASIHHATNVGKMFRPDNPLLPNYKHVPIGYHGRASSLVVSGTQVRRPMGQLQQDGPPIFGLSTQLDYELEVGCFVGPGNPLGTRIPVEQAEAHVFGLCLVNDWSARDIQRWEYQPLGPFLGKSFATSVSPWVVTWEALAPYRVAPSPRPDGDPAPLPYLQGGSALDITVEACLTTPAMRDAGSKPQRLSRGSFLDLYWTLGQFIAHHTSNGCNLRPGDLLASGTVSGPSPEARGCLLELTWRGTEPIVLPSGETRRFLEDGDEVTLTAFCEREGRPRIGFGECRGVIVS